jgi:hypothetical protein
MIQAASLGCELGTFFFNGAREWHHGSFNSVQEGGQLYFRGATRLGGDMYIASEVKRPRHPSRISDEGDSGYVERYLCRFDCFAPDSM